MKLYFVGDGVTDEAAIPPLVRNILGKRVVKAGFSSWKSLKTHKGYGRKLLYAIRRARTEKLDGVVATVDCDKENIRDRPSELRAARRHDQQSVSHYPMPTALGQAIPHLEAWLLDDEKAVRTTLGLSVHTAIPNVVKTDAKQALNRLIDASDSEERQKELLGKIASAIDPIRCNHKSDTGFLAFAEDVTAELGVST